jgi:fluoroacetyl-CoA thioesterase
MKDTLQAGLTFRFQFKLPLTKTVPHLYPESEMFQEMPQVLATGFLVGLMEWACIEALRPHLDWPREQSLGSYVNFSHLAATPAGFTVTIEVKLEKVEGRKLTFSLSAHDGLDKISEGTHERVVIDAARFNAKISEKVARGTA